MKMERGKQRFCSGALRLALVLAMAQLLSLALNVQSQAADSVFCQSYAVPYGYNCRQHTTMTADGFLLLAHHISNVPRTTSERPITITTADAPAPSQPVCIITAEQPYETIAAFVRDSDQPRSSTASTEVNCKAVAAPSPLMGSTGQHENFPDSAGSKAYFVHTSERHGLRNPAPSDHSITVLSAADGATAQQTTNSFLEDVAEVPTTQPDIVPEVLAPATTDSQAPSSPPTSGGVSLVEHGEPVLLMHQEFQNGNSWFKHVNEDSDQLLPILLLNSGFDVWVGHQRATYYAHEHVTLTPEDQSYWNWTWDEHAKYDMPALLELVKRETGSTVHFVGISQSATAGAAAATMPFVSPILRSLTLIGPTIYRGNTSSHTLKAWGALLGRNIDSAHSYTEFQNGVFNITAESTFIPSNLGPVSALLTDVSGPNCCLGPNYKVTFDNGWDGTTSSKNLMHYQQGVRTNMWSHFDYGSDVNNSLAYSGSPVPPIYDPDEIPAALPVLVIYGGRDNIAPASGVRQFMSHSSTSPSRNNSAVLLPAYAHFDLSYSFNRTQDVFIPVLQFLEWQRT